MIVPSSPTLSLPLYRHQHLILLHHEAVLPHQAAGGSLIPIITVRKVGVAVTNLVTVVTDEKVSPCPKDWPTVRMMRDSKELLLDPKLPGLSPLWAVEGEEEGVVRGNIAPFACGAGPGDGGESSTYIACVRLHKGVGGASTITCRVES